MPTQVLQERIFGDYDVGLGDPLTETAVSCGAQDFYASPGQRKKDATKRPESGSTSSQSWAYLDGGRALSNSSTSVFRSQACTASSAISISDMKIPAALETSTTHKSTPGQLLRGSYHPCKSDVHRSISEIVLGSGEPNVGLESQSRETECGPVQLGDWIGEDLCLLKSVRLDLGCQYCREHNLGCDRTKPSCWTCEQNNQHCLYKLGESGAVQGLGCLSEEIRIEPGIDDMPWPESLGIHPYHNLEGARKMGFFETWLSKSRRGKSSTVVLRSEAKIILEEELNSGSDDETPLRQDLSAEDEDEYIPIVENGIVNDECSLMSSLTVSSASCYSHDEDTYHSSPTIALELGMGSRRTVSNDSLQLGKSITSSPSECKLQETCFEKVHDTVHDLSSSLTQRSLQNYSVNAPISFHCLFCLEGFDVQEEWAEHEQSQHFAQMVWICMLRSPVENSDDEKDVCVFCLSVDPDTAHYKQHRFNRCLKQNMKDRIYQDEEGFKDHLRIFHQTTMDETTMDEWIENWSFSPANDEWHWFCGFCDEVMATWTHRVEHLSEHFKKGVSISSWNLLVPRCPIEKTTGTPITWFSPTERHREELYTLQLQQLSRVERDPTLDEQDYCQSCQFYFQSKKDAERHKELWHLPHNVWRCPTEADIRAAIHLPTGPLTSYMFPETSKSLQSPRDQCPYCGEESSYLCSGYDSDSDTDSADWKYRVEHLKSKHNFSQCEPDLRFYRPEQFLLHLADSHGLDLGSWMKDVVESCRSQVYIRNEIEKDRGSTKMIRGVL